MPYLDASEYVPFGLSDETGDDLVIAASALIDSFCKRTSLGITQYVERLRFGRRSSVQLSNTPVASSDGIASPLVLVRARTRLRRSCSDEAPCPWITDASVFLAPGEWITVGATYHEVEVTYSAGFATVPTAVKVACAQIVRNAQATPALNVRRQAMDSMQMEYFSNTLLDADVQRLLLPYQSQRMG